MGAVGQGRMTTHQQKKLGDEDLIAFRNRFHLPLSDEQALRLEFVRPADDAPEMRHLRARREALAGRSRREAATPRRCPCLPSSRMRASRCRPRARK